MELLTVLVPLHEETPESSGSPVSPPCENAVRRHAQARKKALTRKQHYWNPDLESPVSRTEKINLFDESHPVYDVL